jgi:hypothetical protein
MALRHDAVCPSCHTNHSDQHHQSELTALSILPTMPQEVQDRVFEFCNLHTLAILCRVDKEWHKRTNPLLWRDIDFVHGFDDTGVRIEASRKFFAVCDTLIDQQPDRFKDLASNIFTLNLGRLLGIYIVSKKWEPDRDDYAYFESTQDNNRNIFDVIAYFVNLEALSVFIKSWWGDDDLKQTGEALAERLTKLRHLKIGGQMSYDIINGLLGEHKMLESLSLINLIQCPGQDNGPDGIVFLRGLENKFTRLKSLHLCKLADLEGRTFEDEDDDEDSDYEREYVSGMSWEFPRESESAVLQEWASLLRHTSSTLEELTLENRFLCSHGFDDLSLQIDPGNSHPADYGAYSVKQTQEALFPVLSEDWPKLKRLTLIGIGKVEAVTGAVCHLESQVHIEQRPAGIELIKGNVTPEQISTPVYFGSGRDRFKY